MHTAHAHHHHRVTLGWQRSRDGILSSAARPSLARSDLLAREGDGRRWSSNELVCGALLGSFWTALFTLAAQENLQVYRFRGRAAGSLNTLDDGARVPSLMISVELEVAAGDVVRAAAIAERARRTCIASSGLDVQVTLDSQVQQKRDIPTDSILAEQAKEHA